MSITISIRTSQSGKPQPKPGIVGALGGTEPEGSFDESVEIILDEEYRVGDLEQVLDAGAKAAITAFLVSFRRQGVVSVLDVAAEAESDDETIEAPHICGPECCMGVEIIEASDPEGLAEALVESIRRARRDLRNREGA